MLGILPLAVGTTAGTAPAPPTPATCPAIPRDAPLIAELASGQVVDDGQSVTLQFSSSVFSCGEWSNDTSSADCRDRWNLSLTVPASAIAPGTYSLSQLGTQFGDLLVTTLSGQGCSHECPMSVSGTGPTPFVDTAATLQIFTVSDQCITGKLTGVKDPHFAAAPNFDGSFFAVRCM
jgi:hypothetical protein